MLANSSAAAPESPGSKLRPETLARMVDVPRRSPEPLLERPDGPATPPIHARRLESVMDASRRSLPLITYLAPDVFPSRDDVRRRLDRLTLELCLTGLTQPNMIPIALDALDDILPPPTPPPALDLSAMIMAGEPADLQVHDAFFNIARSGHCDPALAVKSLFQSLAALHADVRETPTTLCDEVLIGLDRGLRAVIAALLGGRPPSPWTPAPRHQPPFFEDHVTRRWIRGHQIFTGLSQGLIFAVNALVEADNADDVTARSHAAHLIAVVMDASGHALEFTGDFAVQVYDELIRKNMTPPYQPEGFSGLLSADHRELVFRLRAAKPVLDRLGRDDPTRHRRIIDALAGVYDRHKYVCGKFVGVNRASLLMATEGGRSGVEQLERFKATRLRLLGRPGADAG